jgi:hypothetical protein
VRVYVYVRFNMKILIPVSLVFIVPIGQLCSFFPVHLMKTDRFDLYTD